MPNKIPVIERIRNAMAKGWPEGTSALHREMPAIFARIAELEAALEPFALIGEREQGSGLPLASVYVKDLIRAKEVLDPSKGQDVVPRDSFFDFPAE